VNQERPVDYDLWRKHQRRAKLEVLVVVERGLGVAEGFCDGQELGHAGESVGQPTELHTGGLEGRI
jgi:hypothetical protein